MQLKNAAVLFVATGLVLPPSSILADPGDQLRKIAASDGASNDNFGNDVAIAGNYLIVGSPGDGDNGSYSGSVYVYDATSGAELYKLQASDAVTNDLFGYAVAADGTTAVIGAFGNDDLGANSGAAYIFDLTTGQQTFKLLPSDGAASEEFGFDVAINGSTVVIGAYKDNDLGGNAGSAYVFDAITGQQLFKLLPSDGQHDDQFGVSVDVDGTTAIVGSWQDDDNGNFSGAAYIFDTTTGLQTAKMLPDDGSSADLFGRSVSISGNTAVVGASGAVTNGAAYVFDVSANQQLHQFVPDTGLSMSYGWTVAVDGTTAIVSAHTDKNGNNRTSGSVYVYDTVTGDSMYKLVADDGDDNDYFGVAHAISGTDALFGAIYDDDNGSNSGSVYLFDVSAPSCLDLIVDNLIAGDQAIITIEKGTPGARAVTVYGTQSGQTVVNNVSGYCATFAIKGVNQSKVIGGLNRTFDGNGEITFNQFIPSGAVGLNLLFQSAERGTCPDECVSNVVNAIVG